MKENKNLLPERFCSLDSEMSLEKILQAKDNQEAIVGRVTSWNSSSKELEIRLGNGFKGILPIKDASIYPCILANGELTPSIRSLIERTVLLSVEAVDLSGDEPRITLSRKRNMLNAFNLISNSIGKEVECAVTTCCDFGVFVDISNGVTGLIPSTLLSMSRYCHPSDLGIHAGDKITATIVAVESDCRITLNYKDRFENLAYSLNADELVEATILQPLNKSGYFAYVNANTPAVVDVPKSIPCNYGDKIVAVVKGVRTNHPDHLKLAFVSFIK